MVLSFHPYVQCTREEKARCNFFILLLTKLLCISDNLAHSLKLGYLVFVFCAYKRNNISTYGDLKDGNTLQRYEIMVLSSIPVVLFFTTRVEHKLGVLGFFSDRVVTNLLYAATCKIRMHI